MAHFQYSLQHEITMSQLQEAEKLAQPQSESSSEVSVRTHRDDIPAEPRNYREMLRHSHKQYLLKAQEVEIQALFRAKTPGRKFLIRMLFKQNAD